MKKFFSILLMFLVIAVSVSDTAEAARFGGGRSFGMKRSVSNFSRAPSPGNNQPFNARSNRWLAPLAGLALGGLLASLFMGHGLGTGLLTWLAVLGIGYMIWTVLRNKLGTAGQARPYNQYQNTYNAQPGFSQQPDYRANNTVISYPNGFNRDLFLRDAKVQFIRLQAAYDAKDLNDLRQFTVPEVFAEIQIQLQERAQTANHTEVVSLDAELLDVTAESHNTIASVQFSGMIREAVDASAAAFKEIWHFQQDKYSDRWLVSGVQQDA
ncbi:MAG: hypothetical protein A3E84_02705 [Gammaproteobacteria bacterium RIFCSPHIGHO2_12_FULL_42_13]|nr:MAG: hypothetical protein A3E84_02705 [Gammaproteobacteria bacterium RIFCSPHIGHO2_12_FULL_42_13]